MSDSKSIGDVARTSEGRDSIDSMVVIPRLCAQLSDEKERAGEEACGWIARAIGNLCVDHEQNRSIVVENCGVEKLVEIGKQKNCSVWGLRNVCGAIANIAGTRDAEMLLKIKNTGIYEVAENVFDMHVDEKNLDPVVLCVQMLFNLSACDSIRKEMIERNLLGIAYTFFKKNENILSAEYLGLVPKWVAQFDGERPEDVASSGILDFVIELAASDDEETCANALESLSELSQKDGFAKIIASKQTMMPILLKNVEEVTDLLDPSLELVMILASVENFAVDLCANNLVQRLEKLMNENKTQRIKSLCLACISNSLHNSDIVGKLLSSSPILNILLPLILRIPDSDEEIASSHLACSAFRNMFIFSARRDFVNDEFLKSLCALLSLRPKDSANPENPNPVLLRLILEVLGILKVLIKTSEPISLKLSEFGIISTLINCFNSYDLEHTKYESCRCLAYLSAYPACSSHLKSLDSTPFINYLCNSSHELLKSEGTEFLKNLR